MSEKPSGSEPFDLGWIKELVQMMEAHGLSEVDLRKGDFQYKLCRGPQGVPMLAPAPYPMYPPPQVGGQAPVAATAAAPATPAREEGVAIKSPTVGTFYSSPNPSDPAFVKVGQQIQPETVVCLIEAMKVFNQITADIGGTILEVCAKNGDAVEFGQTLFRVRAG